MATLNFDESIVLILFAQAIGANPTQADIIGFDAQLQRDFGSKLHDIMTQEGLEIDVHSRSLVLGCRPHVSGSTASAQLRSACRFVLKARQALGAPLAAPGVPAAGTGAPAAAGARTRRAVPRSARRRTTRRSRSAAGSTRRVRGSSREQ